MTLKTDRFVLRKLLVWCQDILLMTIKNEKYQLQIIAQIAKVN